MGLSKDTSIKDLFNARREIQFNPARARGNKRLSSSRFEAINEAQASDKEYTQVNYDKRAFILDEEMFQRKVREATTGALWTRK